MYEIYRKLRDERKVKDSDVAKSTGITKSTFSDWKSGRSNPKNDKLQKIADYFGVTIDYLTTGKEEPDKKASALTPKDERDIAKDIDNIMAKLSSGEAGPASYNGKELTPEAAELFRDEIEIALKRLKIINKELYTPKKYKK